MDLERILRRTLDIQAIPAPTFDEGERAAFVEARFRELALEDVAVDPSGNVLGRLGDPDAPTLVVCAHLDSVFTRSEVTPARRTEGKLSGPGIGDNALGLAALLELAHDLRAAPSPACTWLAATTAEEGLGNLRGMFALVESFRSRARAYVVVEGMSLGNIYHRGLPARRLRLWVRTRGGHSWTQAGQPSAVHELVRVSHRLLKLPLPATPRTSLNLGRMTGGSAVNAVASEACVEIDLRSEDEQTVAGLEAAVLQVARSHATAEIRVETQAVGSRPDGGITPDHPLVVAAVSSLRTQDIEARLGAGSTDASAPLSLGLPAVCLGVTRGSMAHSQEETIEIPPIRQGYAALLGTVREAARLAKVGIL